MNAMNDKEPDLELRMSGQEPKTIRNSRQSRGATFLRVMVFSIALFATLIPITVGEIHPDVTSREVDRYLMLHGYLPMTAQQLLELVKFKGINAYWIGPITGARYILDNSEIDRVTLRYLLPGESIEDSNTATRIITTYQVKDGDQIIEKASKESGTTSFTNANGATAFYYNKFPKNVYVEVPKEDIEIEIYDHEPGRAFVLAATEGLVRPIS